MHSKQNTIIAALLLSVVAAPLFSQDLPYDSGSTGADGDLVVPQTFRERYSFASGYYPPSDQIVLFGGMVSHLNVSTNQTLIFDGTTWSDAEPATFLSPRRDAAMVYDPVNQVMVMFGGLRSDGVRLNETWLWDGTDWTQAQPSTVPTARDYHEMFWDSTENRVLMFGGESGSADLVDLWEWDGTDWNEITVSNNFGNPRSSQSYYEIVYEESTNRLIMYSENYRQTWALDLSGLTLTWVQISTSTSPDVGNGPSMVYDPTRGNILLAGGSTNSQTWVFENNDWQLLSPDNGFAYSYLAGLVYNSSDTNVYRLYGYNNNRNQQETYSWDGTNWSFVVGRNYFIDMTAKADGIWNYESVFVPSDVDVYFTKNAANSPVVWLVNQGVEINGRVILNGQNAFSNDQSGRVAIAGPGGFDGGLGGVRRDVSGTYVGTPGFGPGGGIPPTDPNTHGSAGRYDGVYGNRLIQPLVGGSGGSGASSNDTQSGGNGGAGGGAILIAASLDVVVNGSILANGGQARTGATVWNSRYGGGGSGGAIRIVADRISGSGSVSANGGDSYGTASTADGKAGRIRLEGFIRALAPNASPVPSATAPTETQSLTTNRELVITNVAGEAVGNNPTGSLLSPDVVFSESGSITISVGSTNIPEGTPVELRITTAEGVIDLPLQGDPEVTLDANGEASFSTEVPAGLGSIQATAEFLLGN